MRLVLVGGASSQGYVPELSKRADNLAANDLRLADDQDPHLYAHRRTEADAPGRGYGRDPRRPTKSMRRLRE